MFNLKSNLRVICMGNVAVNLNSVEGNRFFEGLGVISLSNEFKIKSE